MAKEKIIRIQCEAADSLAVDQLLDFQGDLKKITPTNLDRLKQNMIRHGFTAPMFVWKTSGGKTYVFDGHQRIKALRALEKDGYKIPGKLPVDYIHAKTKKQAKEKFLGIASQFGDFQKKGLDLFIEGMNLEVLVDEIRLPGIDTIDILPPEFEPTSAEEQGKLDEFKGYIICPNCGHQFNP